MGDRGRHPAARNMKESSGYSSSCWLPEDWSLNVEMGLNESKSRSCGTSYEVIPEGTGCPDKAGRGHPEAESLFVGPSMPSSTQPSLVEQNFSELKRSVDITYDGCSLQNCNEYEVSGKLHCSLGKVVLHLERLDQMNSHEGKLPSCSICGLPASAMNMTVSKEEDIVKQNLGHKHIFHGVLFSQGGALLLELTPNMEEKRVSSIQQQDNISKSVKVKHDGIECKDNIKSRTSKRMKKMKVTYSETNSDDEITEVNSSDKEEETEQLGEVHVADEENVSPPHAIEEQPDAEWWVKENTWNEKSGKERKKTHGEKSRDVDDCEKHQAVKGAEVSIPLKPKSWVCPQPGCSRAYTEKCNMEGHMRIHTGEKPYKCKTCGKSYHLNRLLRQHMWSHTGEKPFRCNVCGEGFIRGDKLKRHLQNHIGEKPFKCEWCNKGFVRKEHKLKHLRTHTGERPYQCDECGRAFAVHSTLVSHKRAHAGIKDFKCNLCSKTFRTSSHLKIHTAVHSGEKQHQCDICGKRFAWKDKLKRHLQTHSDVIPYSCQLCTKKYRTQEKLNLHMKDHANDKPFSCSLCKKSFARTDQFKKHQKQHAEMFQCHVCLRFLTEKNRLDKHLRRHETDKRRGNTFHCHICEKILASKESLSLHLNRIHGQDIPSSARPPSENPKRFQCDLCLKLYSRNQNLKCHIQKVHPHLFQSTSLEPQLHTVIQHPKLEFDPNLVSAADPGLSPSQLPGLPTHHLQPQMTSHSQLLPQPHQLVPHSVGQVSQPMEHPVNMTTAATYLVTYPSYSYTYQC